jgi:hypothetical protein
MRVEVDINLLMMVDAHDAKQTLLNSFAGWARYTSISPNGDTYALSSQDVGDARGLSGWHVWDAALFDFAGKRDIYLPEGTFSATGTAVGEGLPRAQAHTWQPDGQALAVVLPPLWSPGIPPNEEYGHADEAGELWLTGHVPGLRPKNSPTTSIVSHRLPGCPSDYRMIQPDTGTSSL